MRPSSGFGRSSPTLKWPKSLCSVPTGEILEFDPDHRLGTTQFSPLTGQADVPENYHTLTWTVKKQN